MITDGLRLINTLGLPGSIALATVPMHSSSAVERKLETITEDIILDRVVL